MRERGRCWEENYDEVREINDKSHSESEREREKKKGGGVKKEKGKGGGWKDSAKPNVYISHHGTSDARRLADKTDPSLKQRQKRTRLYRAQLSSYAGQTTFPLQTFPGQMIA